MQLPREFGHGAKFGGDMRDGKELDAIVEMVRRSATPEPMTGLEKEAEKSLGNTGWPNCGVGYTHAYLQGYLAGAMPRQKKLDAITAICGLRPIDPADILAIIYAKG